MTTPPHSEDFVVAEPLVMFFVGRYVGSDLSKVYPADVYAAVRGWWRIAEHMATRVQPCAGPQHRPGVRGVQAEGLGS